MGDLPAVDRDEVYVFSGCVTSPDDIAVLSSEYECISFVVLASSLSEAREKIAKVMGIELAEEKQDRIEFKSIKIKGEENG